MNPRILIIDTYYPGVLTQCHFNPFGTYESNLRRLLDFSFGTADFYSRNLAKHGWDAIDIIANHYGLQQMWAEEHNANHGDILAEQIRAYDPDVLFFQDLSVLSAREMQVLGDKYVMAGQCSCPMPSEANVRCMDILFTSFPHYIRRFEEVGVRAIFNPLGFESSVLPRLPVGKMDDDFKYQPYGRIHDVVFIGGVGNPSHWKRGMETLNTVAEQIPTFKWWGYGEDLLPPNSALRQRFQGPAWGMDMYQILKQSKIALCRHGEVSEGYSNAMRLYESTGCGAMLLTERSLNFRELFTGDEAVAYDGPADAVRAIQYYLNNPALCETIAMAGQQRTLRDHTYFQRMQVVSDALKELL